MNSTEFLRISLVVLSVALLVTAQQEEKQKTNKDDIAIAKRYREQEPPFRPPPLPIQRKLQVFSGAEQPPSFFRTDKNDNAESRQFEVPSVGQQPVSQQPATFQQQSTSFPQADSNQFQQRQQFDPNQFQQFNQAQAQDPSQQSFQQTFQEQNNFQSRQQENLPTLPPVFIPPNQPVGPPPALQSPIRNLFREPEPSFSLAGLIQRFLRLFNLGNN